MSPAYVGDMDIVAIDGKPSIDGVMTNGMEASEQ